MVAERLECSTSNYYFYESGRQMISTSEIRRFAWALGCDPHELIDALIPDETAHAPVSVPRTERLRRIRAGQIRVRSIPVLVRSQS